jgi:hypothetical protein
MRRSVVRASPPTASTFTASMINRSEPRNKRDNEGKNKLRTYAKFKSDFIFEPYLLHVQHEGKRLLLFKLRVGIAPLRIETGRYESNVDLLSGTAKKGVYEECRICQVCFGGIENEAHFILRCPAYALLRSNLIKCFVRYCNNQKVPLIVPTDLESDELFVMLMKCQDCNIVNVLANFIWDAFEVRSAFLGHQ